MLAIALTIAACVAAIMFAAPLRARYWAWRLAHVATPLERGAYFALLSGAGEDGRWAAAALLAHEEPDVRQFGVLMLHHTRSAWARRLLIEHLSDPDPHVQHLAAVGLAIQRDNGVIPTLTRIYRTGDAIAAATACVALEHLGTGEAIAALQELAAELAGPRRRTALVEALRGIGRAECVPALLALLSDHRACGALPSSQAVPERALLALQSRGYVVSAGSRPTSMPTGTIAEQAAAALTRITGLKETFSSDAPAAQRDVARQRWATWYADRAREP